MAYEIIRHTEFPGKDDGAGYALDLLQEGGTPITIPSADPEVIAVGELQLGAEPLVATYQMGDLPWGPRILNVELHLLNEDTLLQNIRGGDEEQYRLRLTKGTWDGDQAWGARVTSGAVQWVCKIRPKKTQRLIQDRVARQVIQADDGLEQLQYYAFLDGAGAVFTGRNELGDIIHTILNKLGLSLGFKHISNWYVDSAAASTDDGIKSQTYGAKIDQEWIYARMREQSGGLSTFVRLRKQLSNLLRLVEGSREPEDDPPSCWDVLNLILEEWQLVLYQAEGGWWIEQAAERHSTLSPYVWTYSSAGALTSNQTETLGLVYSDTVGGNYHQIDEAKEWQMPALTYARVRYQHDAISEDLIPSRGFRDWDTATGYPRGWSRNGTKLVPKKSFYDDFDPAMQYDYTGAGFTLVIGTWPTVLSGGDYMYCTTPSVTVVDGDAMSFRFRCRYNFAEPLTANYYFRAFARVLHTSSGKYLSGTNDTSTTSDTPGEWSTDVDNRIDLIAVPRFVNSGERSHTFDITIATDTNLGLPAGASTFRIELWDGTDNQGYLDRIHWAAPEIIYSPQDAGENEETITKIDVATAQSGIEALPDRVFYFGTGPIGGSSAARITYGASDTDPTGLEGGYIVLDSGAGSGTSSHADRWLIELMKLRRLGPLVYSRILKVTSNVCYEGQNHLKEGSNYYYAHRMQRFYRSGIVKCDWVELRQDSSDTNIEDITRDWPKKRWPDDEPTEGGFVTPFLDPSCLNRVELQALYPMIEAGGNSFKLLNAERDVSSAPDGTLVGTASNWTWGVNGLSKTVTGTTEHVQLANDLLGATTPSRLTVFNQLRRDTSSEISVWRVTAGVQTVIECKILTTGVVRLAVTDEGGSTTNIDSEPTIENGEWAGVSHSLVPNGTYTTVYAHVLNKDNEESIQQLAIINANVSLDFTDIKLFYSGELTIRLSHWLVQAWTRSMFNSEAICARDFTVNEGVDPGDVTNPQPAMIFRTSSGVKIYDLAGNQVEDWTDASFIPGANPCRPAWHPGHSKVFYHSGQYVRSADQDGANQATEYDAGSGVTITGIQYSPANGRLYVSKTEAAAQGFGYLSGSPGAMSYNSLFTTKDMQDFFADAAHNVIVYSDSSDSDLYALVLSTFVQLDTAAESNSVGVWYTRSDQEAWRMDSSGNVFRQTAANVALFATTRFQQVDGSGFTSPRSNTLMIEENAALMFLVANDHIMVAPHAVNDFAPALTSSDFADIATLGSTCRGASLAMINISPSLAAPVLSLDSVTSTTVTLSWPDIAGEQSYVLQRANDVSGSPGTWVTQPSLAADTITTTRTGETAETTSHWRIRGQSASGAGPWSNVVAATTTAAPADQLIIYGVNAASQRKLLIVDTDGTLQSTINVGGTNTGAATPAYLPSEDCYVYANGQKVRAVNSDGTNDREVHDFGAGVVVRSLYYSPGDSKMYYATTGGNHYGTFSATDQATWTANDISTAIAPANIAIDSVSDWLAYMDRSLSNLYSRQVDVTYRDHVVSWGNAGALDLDIANDLLFATTGITNVRKYSNKTDLTTVATTFTFSGNIIPSCLAYVATSDKLFYMILSSTKVFSIPAGATGQTHAGNSAEVYDASSILDAGVYGMALK